MSDSGTNGSGKDASGFVLAGGRSVRMGRDKALLSYRGGRLLEHVAGVLSEVLPAHVAIVGDPSRYGCIGYPVLSDRIAGCGPLGGIHTALSVSPTDWNLVVACDMPNLEAAVLRTLVARAMRSKTDCVTACGPSGDPEPLCAVYHRRCLPVLERAIRDKRLKMRNLLSELKTEPFPVDAAMLANLNTPAEWTEFQGQPG